MNKLSKQVAKHFDVQVKNFYSYEVIFVGDVKVSFYETNVTVETGTFLVYVEPNFQEVVNKINLLK